MKELLKLIRNKDDLGTGIYYSHKILTYYQIIGPSTLLIMKYYYKCIYELNRIRLSDLEPRMQNILVRISEIHNELTGAKETNHL